MFKTCPISVVDLNKPKIKRRTNKISANQSSRQGYSPFPMEIATLCANFFLSKSSLVVDPFAGWGQRSFACKSEELPYIGYDKSPEAIEYAKNTFQAHNTLADSLIAEFPYHDALLTCPPYGNLERYQGGGLSDCKHYDEFLILYEEILTRVADKALPDSTYCIMVGDWRKKGVYHNFSTDTENIMLKLGFTIHDKVICNQKKTANWRIMLKNAKKFLYTAKVHQYLLVFKN